MASIDSLQFKIGSRDKRRKQSHTNKYEEATSQHISHSNVPGLTSMFADEIDTVAWAYASHKCLCAFVCVGVQPTCFVFYFDPYQ